MLPIAGHRLRQISLNESPYEKVGKSVRRVSVAVVEYDGLNESPYEKVGK